MSLLSENSPNSKKQNIVNITNLVNNCLKKSKFHSNTSSIDRNAPSNEKNIEYIQNEFKNIQSFIEIIQIDKNVKENCQEKETDKLNIIKDNKIVKESRKSRKVNEKSFENQKKSPKKSTNDFSVLYKGKLKNGKKHGFGSIKSKANNNKIFYGEFFEDKYKGVGKLKNINAENFVKSFDYKNFDNLDNKWDKYEGEFDNGKFHGYGTLLLVNKEKYIGNFLEGQIHGEGVFIKNNDETVVGVWEQNKLLKKF